MNLKNKLFKVGTFIKRFWYVFAIVFVIGIIVVPKIIDRLTSVDTLTERIHERSKYKYRVGATCKDGWHSNATSSGACSHHGGVKDWLYETAFHKTWSECKTEAEELSWVD